MTGLADRIEAYVRERGRATEAELVEALGQARPFVREALLALAPADPESKKPSPRAGSLVVDADGNWTVGVPPPPAPPEPERCSMTADGAHIPSRNPLYPTLCAACSHEIGPTDPLRKGYERPVASIRPVR